ncbi:deoxyribose-phosphate aldolase [Hespellia stercorisuis]|uniref:Deoxyribose-phosphate aldolase n=1 Tax=Hespellia stercorisuis DSM 15480 TaxID=1121950 RepID=A0A1M6RC47_9FIRM|nr:deoxyribose-phosphate aldolase [Hespellia stercorisuis]SHK30031.1 deoxyribose-phosphate aldolase [Hespellia stercorisuis DSM 15480]
MKEIRKDILTKKDIAYMMDPSVLKLDTTIEDVRAMVELCKKYDCGTCFCWPCYYPELVELLKGTNTAFGTSLGFPSGQEATATKVQMAEYFMTMNPVENDMVMNVGWLKSGKYDLVLQDIKAVREAVKGTSMKVIIEAMLLTDDEIRKACELCIEGGADYVKTGTGFSANPTTLHHVKVITDTVGDRAKVKVAGGVRSLDTLLKMYKLGASRFGIGCASAEKILKEVDELGESIDINKITIDESEL